jgi:RNA 2',3'-cyclic 3'-phosphodiesterase
MIRLFTALEIPDLIASRLTALQDGPPGFAWHEPHTFHITLAFLGEIEEPQAAAFDDVLRQIRLPPFEVGIKGAGAFGGERPHSVWAGVEPSDSLTRLFEKNQSAMRRAGLEPEKRKFKPHVTLGRTRHANPVSVQEWVALSALFDGGTFTAERFVLFSSHPGRNGPHYEAERDYPLGPVA